MKSDPHAEILPEVAAFLGESPLPAVIDGENAMSAGGEVFCTRDPGSGQPLADVAAMQADGVDRAVKAAQRAFDATGWPRLSPNERGVLLHRLADLVERRKPILGQIEALDAGKILAQAEDDVQNCVDTLRYYTPTWRSTRSEAEKETLPFQFACVRLLDASPQPPQTRTRFCHFGRPRNGCLTGVR